MSIFFFIIIIIKKLRQKEISDLLSLCCIYIKSFILVTKYIFPIFSEGLLPKVILNYKSKGSKLSVSEVFCGVTLFMWVYYFYFHLNTRTKLLIFNDSYVYSKIFIHRSKYYNSFLFLQRDCGPTWPDIIRRKGASSVRGFSLYKLVLVSSFCVFSFSKK